MVELAAAGNPGSKSTRAKSSAGSELYGRDPRGAGGRTCAPSCADRGADAFLGLPAWHRWRELFDLAHFVVVARPGVELDLARAPALRDQWKSRRSDDASALRAAPAGAIVTQPVTAHDISATAIRAELARGAAGFDVVRSLLPPAVLAYIERNHLYR
jgi:nicotinate-nucleotide adenylyltransferase